MRRITIILAVAIVTLLPRPARAANTVGINTHIPAPEVIDLVVELGARWIRVDDNWPDHPDPCSQSIGWLPALDTAVDYAVAHGLSVYMTLAYTPACASAGDGAGDGPRNDVPQAALYHSFVRQTVAHYRAKGVTHFGLWNEPNLSGFFEGDGNAYVNDVVVPGMAGIAQGCADAGYSDCLALGPDLAHVGDYDVFLDAVLQRMAQSSLRFDIFTHHIYQGFDVAIYDGDSFINALDTRRFPFTRRSLVNVLTDNGLASGGVPAIEVWLTETGYRANPPTDAGEMATQKSFYMSVIDQQLARSWYTNTFFYEIVDSMDSIDGFGITRRDGMGGFTRKPAFDALRDRIASEPELNGTAAEPDAGPGPGQPDAGPGPSSPDGGSGGGGPDGGGGGNGSGDGTGSGGCSTGGGGAGALLLAGLALLFARRRRR